MSILIKHIKYALRCILINNANKRNLANNQHISLFCNNCVGGSVLHDFKLQYCTPTINTWIPDESYIKLVKNIEYYKEQKLVHLKKEPYKYIVAQLDDVTIHFMREIDFQAAQEQWERRFKRVDFDNVYILFVATLKASRSSIDHIKELNIRNKMILSYTQQDDIDCCFHIKGFEKECNKTLIDYKSKFSINRGYDQFNFVKWFSTVKEEMQ